MELDLDFKHNRGTGYEPCKFHEGHNKGAAIYVGSTTTVHNILFYVCTLWLNNLTVTFLLVSRSCKIQNLFLFVHGQG